jgi:pimeloyl-ACP methyl ester carboxylesterase
VNDSDLVNLPKRNREISMRTLVIFGTEDSAISPKLLDGMERYIPDLTIRKIPNASHWVQTDAPNEVAQHMEEFLKGIPATKLVQQAKKSSSK